MAIWVGFIPTGLAPIFLPTSFFQHLALWPAIAHEIGHDFLAATPETHAQLRDQLGLVSEEQGARPLDLSRGDLTLEALRLPFGVWFEEIFCDVFGTLMLGPAYAQTMVQLFAAPERPAEVLAVTFQAQGYAYDHHPPRALRLLLSARVLEQAGLHEDAAAIRASWQAVHDGTPEAFFFPTSQGYWGVPAEALLSLGYDLVDRLYGEQLDALSGFRLQDIPGVDFSPGRQAEVEQATSALLAGQIPATARARAVIAAAVCATLEVPEREAELMALARRTIPGIGTTEHTPDAFDLAMEAGDERSPAALRQALILHTVLAPPRAYARRGHGRSRGFWGR